MKAVTQRLQGWEAVELSAQHRDQQVPVRAPLDRCCVGFPVVHTHMLLPSDKLGPKETFTPPVAAFSLCGSRGSDAPKGETGIAGRLAGKVSAALLMDGRGLG